MWALVQGFSAEAATEMMNLKFTKNCVKLLTKILPYIKKAANLCLLKPLERNILANFYFDLERNYTKSLLYALYRQMKA